MAYNNTSYLLHRAPILYRLSRLHQTQCAVGILRHQNHTVRRNTFDFLGSEVNQHQDLLANQILRFVVFGDTGNHFAGINTCTDLKF